MFFSELWLLIILILLQWLKSRPKVRCTLWEKLALLRKSLCFGICQCWWKSNFSKKLWEKCLYSRWYRQKVRVAAYKKRRAENQNSVSNLPVGFVFVSVDNCRWWWKWAKVVRSRISQYCSGTLDHFVHRWRQGYLAVSRIPNWGACREEYLPWGCLLAEWVSCFALDIINDERTFKLLWPWKSISTTYLLRLYL